MDWSKNEETARMPSSSTEAQDEKLSAPSTASSPTEASLHPQTTSKEFEPITATPSRAHSQARPSLSRTRSNNGYGVGGVEEGHGTNVEAGTGMPVVKDQWEVAWEGGDMDPLCPRSLPLWRKWMIVIIVSASSLCV